MIEGIKGKACAHEDAMSTAQSVKQDRDCSQIEIEEEEEEEYWQKENQMEVQSAEEAKLEESLERRRMAGSSLQAEVMQNIPELVVHERMSQGEEVRGTSEKKKVKGWSTEDMVDKPNSLMEEDTEEMRKWRGMNQEVEQMVEEVGGEDGGRGSGQVQGREQQKRR